MHKLLYFFISLCLVETGDVRFAVLQMASVGLVSVLGIPVVCKPCTTASPTLCSPDSLVTWDLVRNALWLHPDPAASKPTF